ncbi:MAG: hypothetical protein AAF215_04065 [Cyanobacteria bacterium P01_A01_bin.123]
MTQQYANQYSTHYPRSGHPPSPPAQPGDDWQQGAQHYQAQSVLAPDQQAAQYSNHYLRHPASPPMPSQPQASAFYPPQRQQPTSYSKSATYASQPTAAAHYPPSATFPTVQPGAMNQGGYGEPMPLRRPGGKPKTASYFLAGGSISMLAMMALLVFPGKQQATVETGPAMCQEVVKEDARLSRSALSQVLAVAERSPKEKINEILAEPYCILEPLAVREGANARREAYPLEFDIDTWFVVLYEEGEYAGYDFSFRGQ